ncbi:MAG: c-type cytochrome domain-containing protein [Fuerstiella sp.]
MFRTASRQIQTGAIIVLLWSATSQVNAIADEEQAIVPADVQLGRPIDFQADVYPILQANCIACHNKTKSEGDLNLEDGQTIMKGGSSGQVVTAGKPDESYLYNVVARKEESFMPPWPNEVQAKKLTPQELGILRQWIVEGAKTDSSGSGAAMQWQKIDSGLHAIYSLDADPYGRFVAAGRAGTVAVYDLQTQDQPQALVDPALVGDNSVSQTAHRDYVHAIAFHPSGEMLATAGFQVVKLWQRDKANAATAVSMPAIAKTMVSSADTSVIAIHNADGYIRSIDAASGKILSEIPGYDPSATTLLGIHGPENQWVSIATAEAVVSLVNRTNGNIDASSEALASKATSAAFISDANKLVVLLADGTLQPMSLDAAAKTLVATDAVKPNKGAIQQIAISGVTLMCRTEAQTIELRKTDSLQITATIQTSAPVNSSTISADAQRVVTVNTDGKAELWNAADGKLLATLNTDILSARSLQSAATNKAVRDARVAVVKGQITEDEKRVTEQQESLKKADEEVKKTTDALTEAKKKLEEAVTKATEAKTGSEAKPEDDGLKKALEAAEKAKQTAADAVTAAEGSLKSAEKSKVLSQQAIERAEARVAERKSRLAEAESEAKLAADAHTTADAAAKQTITAVLASFAGNTFVATVDAGGTTRLWNFNDGTPIDVLPGNLPENEKPIAVANGTRNFLLQNSSGNLSRISAFPAWKLSRVIGPDSDGQNSAFVDRVLSLAFSPDGTILAAGGGEASRTGELTLWNVADGTLLRTFKDAHSDTVYGIDFSADGKLIASASADKFVKVFNVATGDFVRAYEGHTHHVMDVSWKGDGTTLASAGADNAIKVWNAETGEQSRTISTYTKQVTSLSFIGLEDDFISCSGDKRVFRHKAANGGTVREFKGCPDYVYCSATTADGKIVAAGCEDGILRIWNGADGKEIAAFTPAK